MLASDIPDKIELPFANTGSKNVIPVVSQIGITDGAASFTDGFPPLTMTPKAAGGIPPSGLDVNGILNAITAVQQWQSAGGHFKYDATFSTAIGGYPAGAILQSTDGKKQWLNLADNNTTDPDGGSPANWSLLSGGRLVRTTVYINNGGTLQSSVDGGAFANASSTFDPLSVTNFVDVEVQGGGGAGGGAGSTTAGTVSAGAGGGGGGYCRKKITSGFSGVTITVGAGGVGGTSTGGAGGSSSFGAILSATGGSGGAAATAQAPDHEPKGFGPAGIGTGGTINARGGQGRWGFMAVNSQGGDGGASAFGGGAVWSSNSSDGLPAESYGAGGSGGSNKESQPARSGGNGKGGLVIVREYA